MNFQNKTAVITGAASGMGLLFCQKFVELGGNAVLIDLNRDVLEEKTAEINAKFPGRAVCTTADVRNYEEISTACDLAVKTFGSIDVASSFAGGAETRICHATGDFPENPIEIYDWSIDVNLKGQIHLAHAAMKQMKAQNSGVFLSIGSVTGDEGCAANIGYASAKSGAMIGLTKSLARFGAPYGIRCVCVSPGPVLTRPGMASMKTALGRAAEPMELVNMMLFAVSEDGAFLDGVNILMDGGRSVLLNKNME